MNQVLPLQNHPSLHVIPHPPLLREKECMCMCMCMCVCMLDGCVDDDPCGPMGYVVASETCALGTLGASFLRYSSFTSSIHTSPHPHTCSYIDL